MSVKIISQYIAPWPDTENQIIMKHFCYFSAGNHDQSKLMLLTIIAKLSLQEEERLNEDYAKRLATDGRNLTREKMDKLLNDHLISMQALRQKQEQEKEEAQKRLQTRLGQLSANTQPQTMTMKTGTVTEFTVGAGRARSGSSSDSSRTNSQQNGRPLTAHSVAAVLGGSLNGSRIATPARIAVTPMATQTLNGDQQSDDEFSEEETVINVSRFRLVHTLLGRVTQIAKFMGPTWGPPGSCRPQMGPMLAPWTLLSR